MNLASFSLFACALALAGCGGGSSSSSGTLSVGITDAPVDDATDVVIEVQGLEIKGPGGITTVDYPAAKQFHLLTLTDGASSALLSAQPLPAGHYEWIRLKVNTAGMGDSYVVTSTGTYEITIPSSSETGLKLVRGFDVPAGGSADFTVDFDLRKSLVEKRVSDYTLKPVLRIVDNVSVGGIAGNVDLATYGCGTTGDAVYVYPGSNATLSDINTLTGTGPALVAPVRAPDTSNGNYHYHAAFLSPGDYTVALTCAANSDLPESSETIAFKAQFNVTVTANNTTTQSFP